jgi:hypothetical protein
MAVTVAAVRKMALALPETEEVLAWGEDLTWRVGNKIFAMGHPKSPQITVKASKEDQTELIASDPNTYSYAAYVGRFGWVAVKLANVGRDELNELLIDAWRATAPKKLVKAYEDGTA